MQEGGSESLPRRLPITNKTEAASLAFGEKWDEMGADIVYSIELIQLEGNCLLVPFLRHHNAMDSIYYNTEPSHGAGCLQIHIIL